MAQRESDGDAAARTARLKIAQEGVIDTWGLAVAEKLRQQPPRFREHRRMELMRFEDALAALEVAMAEHNLTDWQKRHIIQEAQLAGTQQAVTGFVQSGEFRRSAPPPHRDAEYLE